MEIYIGLRVKEVKFIDKDYKLIRDLYNNAFPKIERFPIVLLKLFAMKPNIEFLSVYDNDVFCGILYLVNYKDKTLIYYFAVRSDLRSRGYGSKILTWIKQEKKSVSLIMETVREECDNLEQRLKRRDFYFRNGFIDTGYYLKDHSGTFDILSTESEVDAEEFIKMIKQFTFWTNNIEVGKFDTEEKVYNCTMINS
ncbi:GNAT family N-acetyltransferase [Lutispora thermophila]|uniref:Acetyltransferase (GNAT) domain-containing protein n=1 Tax=Lutispora thermophila DSM 19022 TaxID=1122184 RepID=A0A1M6CYK2_9FIRM|nr:GNAT family N-acetyltransferase [Lutispora thermophila]SHI65884.1 Acetyltransferase (GNAT) domain-containing protein [Lutispora thermophila DSM 19022]